jgi:acetyl esterase
MSEVIPEYLAKAMGDWAVPQSLEDVVAGRERFSLTHLNVNLPEMAEVHDHVVLRERQGTQLTAEIYVPPGDDRFPTLLYIHGGAFCLENSADVRRLAMRFAEQGYVVVNINYGLAPEHPFPWAVEDCVYAARWIARNISDYHGDGSRLVVSGDSAGANLAAATIIALSGFEHALDEGDLAGVPVRFAGAVLFYGPFDSLLGFTQPGDLIGVTEVMWHRAYMGPHFLKYVRHPLASPIYAPNLGAFPPTYLSCGHNDSLLPHTLRMTSALPQNVAVTTSILPGTAHFFAQFDAELPQVEPELQRIFAWLRSETLGK